MSVQKKKTQALVFLGSLADHCDHLGGVRTWHTQPIRRAALLALLTIVGEAGVIVGIQLDSLIGRQKIDRAPRRLTARPKIASHAAMLCRLCRPLRHLQLLGHSDCVE